MIIEKITSEIVDAAVKVECEVTLPIIYDGQKIDPGYRLDMLVENQVIIENKAVEQLLPIHQAQLLSYLKLGECSIGFLLKMSL